MRASLAIATSVLALALSSTAIAGEADPWTSTQTALEVAGTASLLIDFRQTLQIKNHTGYSEYNLLLGKHPSDVRIQTYFVLSGIAQLVVADYLPSSTRTYFLGGVLSMELVVTHHNKGIGLSYKF